MALLTMKEFMKDTKTRVQSDILDWKKMGEIVVYLHPASGIAKRRCHWFPTVGEKEVEVGKGKNKKKVKKEVVYNIPVVCPVTKENKDADPICNLRKMLRENDDIDSDTVILRLETEDDIYEYTKGDIIGEEGYDWKKNLSYKKEYLFGVINVDNPEKVEIAIVPHSLGKDTVKEIEDKQKDYGEEEGDPFQNPYPFRWTYDDQEFGADMYRAKATKSRMNDKIQKLLEDEDQAVDLEQFSTPMDPIDIAELVEKCLVYDEISIEDLLSDDDYERYRAKKKEKKNRSNDSNGSKNSSKKDKESESEEESKSQKRILKKNKEDEESKEKEKEEQKPKKRMLKKNKEDEKPKEVPMDDCPACGEKIPRTANECPHCGAEFEEEMITCTKCGEETPISELNCKHCGKELEIF